MLRIRRLPWGICLQLLCLSLSFAIAILLHSCKKRGDNTNKLIEIPIYRDSIRAHVEYLASDMLQGRQPGTEGFALATKYVVDQLQNLGLEPGNGTGGFEQNVLIRRGLIDPTNSWLEVSVGKTTERLKYGSEYFFIGDLNRSTNQFSSQVTFAGYGIEAPELNYNDYENNNVKDKIVVLSTGAPESFPSTERAYFTSFLTKFELAVKNGAKGVIIAMKSDDFEYFAQRYSTLGNMGVESKVGDVFGRTVFGSELEFVAALNWKSLRLLFGSDPDSLWNNYNNGVRIVSQTKVAGSTATKWSSIESCNIVAMLQGTNPALKNEYVIYTAHLDHLGIGKPIDGDSIYNGAHDNASGVASVLEIARMFSNPSIKPARSILFLIVTAEEMGLLGSDYFAQFPTVPVGQIVANINIDMPTWIAPMLSIVPLGAKHSTLMEAVRETASMLNLEVSEDPMPEQVRFIRSDQYSFVRQGIPALHIKYGLKSIDSTQNLGKLMQDFLDNTYHMPSDELSETFDFHAAETYVRLNFLIGYRIAQSPSRPQWNKGDMFEKLKQEPQS